MKWSSPRSAMKRLHVKLKPLKLEGLSRRIDDDEEDDKRMVMVEMVWKGPKSAGSMVPFIKSSSKHKRNRSSERIVRNNGEPIEWDDEFESLCDFSVMSKDRGFCSWDVSLNVLHGKNGEKMSKLAVAGKVPMNLSEFVSELECSEIERKLPITLNVDGAVIEATLLISVSFAEVRGSSDTAGVVQSSAESNKEDGFFKKVKGLTRQKNKKEKVHQLSLCDSDESLVFDSDGLHGNMSTTTSESSCCSGELSLGPELESSKSLGTQLEPTTNQKQMIRLFSWKKRRLSFRSFSRKKIEPLVNSESNINESDVSVVDSKDGNCWEVKELVSRDGQSRLKSNVFFASFDQRSEKAAGESACTAMVAVVAHWLHSNQDIMPTRLEFDSLITEGSLEWRKLCDNVAYTKSFPDKHFDLETVLKAAVRPITVLQDKTFTGFFSPEKFDCLKGAMSFDEIWNEIDSNRNDHGFEPRVYIISWNDHFFVLKVESNAYYIIDSLGERLFEGCNQAYILKFDDSSVMHGKAATAQAKQESSNLQETGEKATQQTKEEEANEEMICHATAD
ncbi:hypothetical protein COLO4_18860 [Corchorus olitorius]|uniref:C2 NT-type domain-containing protein n=1 Tax=Corchorus olitorius TaxID=93759 RepID=A0A1R3J7L0_9ROSI|nr:hypothetical protein COLO4_18860 [Corchorus olitorius]